MTRMAARGVIPSLNDGQRLMVARQYVGLTQGELADALGVTTATVQRAESGQTKPRRTTYMAWSMATGVDLHWLEKGHAPPPDGDGACELCAIRDSNPEPADLESSSQTRGSYQCDLVPLRPVAA